MLTFDGAPETLQSLLPPQLDEVEFPSEVLPSALSPGSFRCPISGESISFADFLLSLERRTHGRSEYQVAHLIPLAQGGKHVVGNVSWITELGNRVQGESSLDEIVVQIFSMAYYHKERLGLRWEEVEERARMSR